jgi:hypothetical protein
MYYRTATLPSGDIRLALPYQKGGRILRIGITSAGDNIQVLAAGFGFLLPLNSDFIVCASKSSGSTVAYLQGVIASNGFGSVIVNTTWATSQSGQTRHIAQTARDIDSHIF